MIRYLIIIVLIIAILGLIFYGIPNTDKQSRVEYTKFNTSTIDGVIKYVNIKHHGSSFKLEGDSLEFVFYPYTDKELNNNNAFGDIAVKGDKIYKAAYSDTLVLLKNNVKYNYKFKNIK